MKILNESMKRLHQMLCKHQYDMVFVIPSIGWTLYTCRKCGHYHASGDLVVSCIDACFNADEPDDIPNSEIEEDSCRNENK